MRKIVCIAFASVCLMGLFTVPIIAASSAPQIRQGLWRGQVVSYAIVKGKAVYQGDILLNDVETAPHFRGDPSGTIAYSQYLWPKVNGVATVYYAIDPNSDPNATPKIIAAITQFNADFPGLIQWVQWNSQLGPNYVDIDLNANDFTGSCEAAEGYEGVPAQPMTGSTLCSVGTILHEMGHVIGLWHEQSRSDRDAFLSVNYENIIKGSRFNFDVIQDDFQNLTLYDYSSLMHYPAFSFSRNGGPVLESIPAGIPLASFDGWPMQGSPDYSAADKEGIGRLYGAPPSQITVTSNPPGLQVIVDGSTVTTPQTYTWVLNSVHTFNVPTNVQTLIGNIQNSTTPATFYYTYGRWNDSTAQSHSITVAPGNGEVPFPSSGPQVATYTANFVQLVPYAANVYPDSSGSVSVQPQPQSYPGVSGLFFVARQQATLTATPEANYNFYEFNNGPFWLPGGLGANPKSLYVPDTGNPINTTAEYSPTTVYTVDVTPESFSSNLYAYIDGGFWYTPKNFSSFYDSDWTSGSQHTLNIDSLEYPYSVNSRYGFAAWSDGGAQSHTINLPSSNASYVATVTPEFQPADNWTFGPPCGASSVSITPGSPYGDGFYPTGQVLTFDETPGAGWTFAGWSYDLTGLTNPQNLTVTDEELVFANYNTTSTPLSMITLSPPSAVAGGSSFTLTITGTGFTSGTEIFVNNTFRTSTFVNATTLQVTITAADIASPGAFQIFVQNFPTGSQCSVSAAMPFFVSQGNVLISANPSSLSFGVQAVTSVSVAKTFLLTNNGTTSASLTISPSGDFSQTNNCNGVLGAGASCTVKATFTPTGVGVIDGAVTVVDSAANSPQIVNLSGSGIAPLSLAPTALAFGNQAVGTTSTAKTMTITNNLTTSLNFTFSASGNYSATGSGTSPCGTTLSGKASCTISVTFSPTANGSIQGAVTVADGTVVKQQEVTLSGTGTGGTSAPLTFSPPTLTFASQAFSSASVGQTVTVTNASSSSVTLSSIASSGNYAAAGSGSVPCIVNTVLGANASCTMGVTFTPTYLGVIKGAITINDNASVKQQILGVSGTGVMPVTFAPTSLTFAPQNVGTASTPQTLKLTNNQATALSKVSITASGDFAINNNGCGATLAAHTSCSFSVTFTPSQTGNIIGSVTTTDSAVASPQVVNAAGTGQ